MSTTKLLAVLTRMTAVAFAPGLTVNAVRAPMNRVFVGVGSSIDPGLHLRSGLARLHAEVGIVGVSIFYATPAIRRPSDPRFVNGVVEVGERLAPAALKAVLSRIERGGA